jgi:hypothetical protein
MMNDLQKMKQEKGVLRWGGLAGMLGGIIFILTFVVVIAGPVGMEEITDLDALVKRFPDVRMARVVENGLYLAAVILGVPLFLALYRALRRANLAAALFGSVLAILGLCILAAGSLPHVATGPISDLYHAPGATAVDQATLALMWQATQGLFDALLIAGLAIVPLGLVTLGVAMLGSQSFGKVYGWLSVALGALGLVAAIILLVDPLSPIAMVTIFALIIFYLVLGWKLYSLSRAA